MNNEGGDDHRSIEMADVSQPKQPFAT